MTFHYHIDPERDIPLYQQLVDEITAQIKNGTLPDGEKLPTVQELSDAMGVARGTVIRAYDELTQRRLIEKVQGRGTFVRHTVMDSASRKESAMHLIDKMLDKLTALGISEAEARIFIDLKLSERAENAQRVRVAAVECSPESLSAMSTRLRKLEHIEL